MTREEILTHIRNNKDKLSKPGSCQYINSNDERCVVGLLLTDEQLERIRVIPSGTGSLTMNAQSVSELNKCGFLPDHLVPWVKNLINLQNNFDNVYQTRGDFLQDLELCFDNYDTSELEQEDDD